MKCVLGVVALALLAAGFSPVQAQLKSQLQQEFNVSNGMAPGGEPSAYFLGFLDPSKFQMHHSFSLSYMTAGGQGMSLGTYTNSMMYQFSDKLDARADISLSYSPYNSFSSFGSKKNDLSSLYLSRAQLDYRPWSNFLVQVQYRQLPYNAYYSPFYSPWNMESGF